MSFQINRPVVEPSPTSKSNNSEVKAANPQTSDLSGAGSEGSNVVQRAVPEERLITVAQTLIRLKSRVHPRRCCNE